MAGNSHESRAAIAAAQWRQLQSLLITLLPANRFYATKLTGLDAKALASLSDFSERVPLTTKQELAADQTAHPPYGTNLTFPLTDYTRWHQTSGTTGTPLRWLDPPESWQWMLENWKEVYAAAGVTREDRIFFAFSFGPFIGFWLAFEAAAQIGSLCLPGGGLSSAARLRVMLDNRATVLCCTPTYAIRLAEVAAGERIDLAAAQVKTMIVAGEAGGSIPATRQRLQKLWGGARVFDHHGMTEVGPVTYECPVQPGVLHVIEPAYLAEVIEPASGRSVEPGRTGELVLTTLGRIGSPLLRYRTGDLVKLAARPSAANPEPCACGTYRLGLKGGILGRTDDMIVVRGVNIYPSAVEEIVRSFAEVAEYQVHVIQDRTLAEMRVRIEPVSEAVDVDGLIEHLEKALLNAFALRVPVTAAPRGALPRFELKAKRWMKT